MLSRLNTSSEISLFPTGLGNHYASGSRSLVPPGRHRFPYNHASEVADPGGAAAESSFREPRERFGPDVLVIAGLAMACAGAALTLVSLYLEFHHPAIQATMAGVGPSLVGIGMLFCVLRLFFCTFCVSRTCCERLRLTTFSRPKVHPLRVKDMGAKKAALLNGKLLVNGDPSLKDKQQQNNNNNSERQQCNTELLPERQQRDNTEVVREAPPRMDPIREERRTPEHGEDRGGIGGDDDMLRDEIDLLDSPRLHEDINDLVRKTGRY